MPWRNDPTWLTLLTVVLISLVSGFISIARRIRKGFVATGMWVVSEFMAAVLCGYLMYDLYPTVEPFLGKYLSMPITVAFAAHVGGRVLQETEDRVMERVNKILSKGPL